MSLQQSAPPSMTSLTSRAQQMAKSGGAQTLKTSSADLLARYLSEMETENTAAREIVPASETAVELGSPRKISASAVLWTTQKNLVEDGRVFLVGPDLPECPGMDLDFSQLILLEVDENLSPDPFQLEAAQFRSHNLPGLMARTIPGRLWLRASRKALFAGLDFALMAATLQKSCKEIAGVRAVEVVLVTSAAAAEKFCALASEARILAGDHKRIALGAGGDYECLELNCEQCEEKPVCDIIREVRVIRRRGPAASKT